MSIKKLYGKKKEAEVYDVLNNICLVDNLLDTRNPPLEVVSGCEAMLDGWEEQLEDFLKSRANEDIEHL